MVEIYRGRKSRLGLEGILSDRWDRATDLGRSSDWLKFSKIRLLQRCGARRRKTGANEFPPPPRGTILWGEKCS